MTAEDQFPVGMRVLAVDDDPICLKVLENLLRKCQYHVTTTNQAVTALNMLRENRNKYDLVISDVNMPDMDGFKLLELVGLEMDLPVIMLSSHSDKELVYKGVAHGAVDYLLKPVRMEELKNIWQHVIRKKKFYPKDQNRSPSEGNVDDRMAEGVPGVASSGSSEQPGKVNRKRKDQGEEEDEEAEDGQENEESGTQKKPRVVWSVELHRKFVAAVNQLGLDKAVPKKILDLMNVEGLTRENVASHLQKYRLYLKRISNAASQNANMAAAFGAKDSSYLRMGSLDGFGDFNSLGGAGRLSGSSISSYPPGGMLGRLNSSSGFTLRGISSTSLLESAHSQSLSNSADTMGKLHGGFLPATQVTSLFQGITTLEPSQLQRKSSTHFGEFNCSNNATGFSIASSFPNNKVPVGSLGNTVASASSNSMMFQLNPQNRQSRGIFSAQSSLSVPSLNQESFGVGVQSVHGSSEFLDHSTSRETWQGAAHLRTFPSKYLPLSERFHQSQLPTNNNTAIDFSSSVALTVPLDDSRADMQGQAGLIGNVVHNMNRTSKHNWESQDYDPNANSTFNNMDSLVSGNVMGPLIVDQRKKFDSSLIGQLNDGTPVFQQAEEDPKMRSSDDCFLQQSKSSDGFLRNNYDYDDIMTSMIKREQTETLLVDGEFGFDGYSLGSCM